MGSVTGTACGTRDVGMSVAAQFSSNQADKA
jgi:hypothetical protein